MPPKHTSPPKKTLIAVLATLSLFLLLVQPAGAPLKRELTASGAVIGKVNVTQGGNDLEILCQEGLCSSRVVMGIGDDFHIFLRANNVSADAGYILIDLSDTVNFPHSNTGHVVISWVEISINPSISPVFVGDVQIGYLSDIDETDADVNVLKEYHLERGSQSINVFTIYNSAHYGCEIGQSLLDKRTNQTIFNTGGAVARPGNGTATPANNDVVMQISGVTAGSVDVSVSLGYKTSP